MLVNQDTSNVQSVGYGLIGISKAISEVLQNATYACMLTTSASETGKIVVGSIVALRFGDLSNWPTHRFIGDMQETETDFFDRQQLTV